MYEIGKKKIIWVPPVKLTVSIRVENSREHGSTYDWDALSS